MSAETSRKFRLASVHDIPDGRGREFRVGERFVAIFRDKEVFYAIEDMCPHAGAPMNDGPVANGAVTCLWHGWRFSLRDGSCLNVPRGLPITTFPITVEGDDLYVTLPVDEAEK